VFRNRILSCTFHAWQVHGLCTQPYIASRQHTVYVHPRSMPLAVRSTPCHSPTHAPRCLQAAKYLSAVVPVEASFIGIAITLVALIAFGPVCNMFGGAIFNPVHNIAFMASGKDTMSFNLQRMVSPYNHLGLSRPETSMSSA
jgi:hypothetical protein